MIFEWELWACAHHYIAEHGADAGVDAALRSDELLGAGDLEGAHVSGDYCAHQSSARAALGRAALGRLRRTKSAGSDSTLRSSL